ncbi:MAG: UDP-N-acetylglucosamine 2-epimerase (non-hydrolyzing), partial [Syntrophales bacterium]|nr:UDP-N-acetylglucosamine 2-epimerase (non-hydrolyzing) [Syntrophales bacterium]
MKIATVVGARPQFIKAATVSRAIAAYNRCCPHGPALMEVIIHTGQHYDEGMSAVFFAELAIPEPTYNLGIGSGGHGEQTGRMLAALETTLVRERPDLVLVYGDTNSTLAGALAAAKLHIPIAHIEAGLRSFNRRMPEEINRLITDQLATYLFCPSLTAIENLRREGITDGEAPHHPRVFLMGDVMAQALSFAVGKTAHRQDLLDALGISEKQYLLLTVHRAENTDDPTRLFPIMQALEGLRETVVFPVHPRTAKVFAAQGYRAPDHIKMIDPVGYLEMVVLEGAARLILTDSGGVQKEAYWLKVPCVTLREETEWVETVATGWNILAGTDPRRITDAVAHFRPPAEHPPLYTDGLTPEDMVTVI